MRVLVFSESRLRFGRLSLLFLGFCVPLVFSLQLEDGFELPQILCVLIAASFLGLVCRSGEWAETFKANWFLFTCCFGFQAAGLYAFRGLVHETAFYFPIQNYLWILTFFLFLAPVSQFLEKRKFYAFLVLSGLGGSLYAFVQIMGWDFTGWNTNFDGRSFSTLGNPTFWAGQLLVLIPPAVYLAVSSVGKGQKGFWFAVLGILTASLLMTQTRGAWLGFLGEVILLALLIRGQSLVWKALMLGFIAFLLCLLAVPSLNRRTVSSFQVHGRDAQGRYFLWETAVQQWEEKPWFGQGPGGYAGQFSRIQSLLGPAESFRLNGTARHAHNEYLELLADRGLVGGLLAFLILWILARRRLRKINPMVFSMATAELAVMAGMGIHSLFHFPFSVVPTACVLALLFNPGWDQSSWSRPQEGPLWNEPRFFLSISLLVLCGMGMKILSQNARLHQSIDLASSGRNEEALKLLDFDPSLSFFHYLDPRCWKQKAVVLDGLDREAEAAGELENTVRAYPFDADAYAVLCGLYGKQKDWERARMSGMKALEIDPFHEQALNNLAMVSHLEGREGEAVFFLEKLEESQRLGGEDVSASQTRQKIKLLKNKNRF
jgi:O-antigen ligase